MNKLMITIIMAIVCSISVTNARIGETTEECINRYGVPKKAGITNTSTNEMIFVKSGMAILIKFNNRGIAELICYRKINTDIIGQPDKLSENEIKILLESNGSKWKEVPMLSMNTIWKTENGKLTAQYEPMEEFLSIATQDYIDKRNEEKKKKEEKNLGGF